MHGTGCLGWERTTVRKSLRGRRRDGRTAGIPATLGGGRRHGARVVQYARVSPVVREVKGVGKCDGPWVFCCPGTIITGTLDQVSVKEVLRKGVYG